MDEENISAKQKSMPGMSGKVYLNMSEMSVTFKCDVLHAVLRRDSELYLFVLACN